MRLARIFSRNGDVLHTLESWMINAYGFKELGALHIEWIVLYWSEDELWIRMIEALHFFILNSMKFTLFHAQTMEMLPDKLRKKLRACWVGVMFWTCAFVLCIFKFEDSTCFWCQGLWVNCLSALSSLFDYELCDKENIDQNWEQVERGIWSVCCACRSLAGTPKVHLLWADKRKQFGCALGKHRDQIWGNLRCSSQHFLESRFTASCVNEAPRYMDDLVSKFSAEGSPLQAALLKCPTRWSTFRPINWLRIWRDSGTTSPWAVPPVPKPFGDIMINEIFQYIQKMEELEKEVETEWLEIFWYPKFPAILISTSTLLRFWTPWWSQQLVLHIYISRFREVFSWWIWIWTLVRSHCSTTSRHWCILPHVQNQKRYVFYSRQEITIHTEES